MSDNSLTALRDANPAPVRAIDNRPTVAEMLSIAQRATDNTGRGEARRALGLMSLAFALVVLVAGVAAMVAVALRGSEVPSAPSIPPTETTSTSTTLTSYPPEEVLPTTVRPEVHGVLDELVVRYSDGDVDGVLALLAPGVVKTTIRDAELEYRWDPELLRHQLVVDAALDTSVELTSCQPLQSGSVSCTWQMENDLTRIAELGPQEHRVTLRVEASRITVWQDRQGFHATPYQQLAVAPFTAWLAQTYPGLRDPHPLDGGVSYWWPDRSIVERLPDLLEEYAAISRVDSGA